MSAERARLLVDRARAHQSRGQWLAAESCFAEAAELCPTAAAIWFYWGNCLRQAGRLERAVGCFERALAVDPTLYEAEGNLALTLLEIGRHAEAVARLAGLVEAHPDLLPFRLQLATARQRAGELEAARGGLEALRREDPDHPLVLANLGMVLTDLGDLEAAIDTLEAALRQAPGSHAIERNLAHALLLAGNYERGWRLFEGRRRDPARLSHRFERPDRFAGPPSQEMEGVEGALLLVAEEGLGDTLMFARYASVLRGHGVTTLLECQPPLSRLLGTLAGVEKVLPRGTPLPSHGGWLPLMSAPLMCGTRPGAVPTPIPYLAAESERIERWGKLVGTAPGFRVGLCWSGSARYATNDRRSIPLTALRPLFGLAGVRFFSLQKGYDVGREVEAGGPDSRPQALEDLGAPLDEGPDAFLDTAALMHHLDLIITCDTSVAHLAGALGRPTWLLLCATPNWRWMLNRADTPWYPTMRLWRQRTLGNWDAPVEAVVGALARDNAP